MLILLAESHEPLREMTSITKRMHKIKMMIYPIGDEPFSC